MMIMVGLGLGAGTTTNGPRTKITKAEVIPWDEEKRTWGVRFKFDDGTEDFGCSITPETADWTPTTSIGEEMPVGVSPLLRSADRMEVLKERR